MTKYNIIYADPSWQYDDKMHAGERGVDYKYDTMPISEIKALPVQQAAADDCLLFMWVTMPFLFEAEEVMKSWGFEYKTCGFVWIKTNPKAVKAMKEINALFKKKHEAGDVVSINDLLPHIIRLCFMGNGSYSRSNPEFCLIGRKGKFKRQSKSVRSVVFSPHRQIHSAKPPEIRDHIVELCGDLPRLEIFATERCEGWKSLGNKLDGRDLKDTLLEL